MNEHCWIPIPARSANKTVNTDLHKQRFAPLAIDHGIQAGGIDMGDREHVEEHVARSFLKRKEGTDPAAWALGFGDPEKGEPDILFKDMGIEIGVVLCSTHPG